MIQCSLPATCVHTHAVTGQSYIISNTLFSTCWVFAHLWPLRSKLITFPNEWVYHTYSLKFGIVQRVQWSSCCFEADATCAMHSSCLSSMIAIVNEWGRVLARRALSEMTRNVRYWLVLVLVTRQMKVQWVQAGSSYCEPQKPLARIHSSCWSSIMVIGLSAGIMLTRQELGWEASQL